MNVNSSSLPKKEKSSKNRHKRSRSEGASSVLGKVSWTKNIKSSCIDLLSGTVGQTLDLSIIK